MSDAPRRVIVAGHALARGRKRIPGGSAHPNLVGLIFREVQEAFRTGRIAKSEPAWVIYGRGQRLKHRKCRGLRRFAWTPAETHVYVLKSDRSPDGTGSCWFVLTVLARHAPVVEAA